MHRPWLVFTISCSLFFLSQFYRVSNAVIAPQLLSDLSVDTKGLGLISASFFYAFALTQIPISLFLDKIGPRRMMTTLSAIGIIGAVIFSRADSITLGVTGRVLMGVGMACNLMGTYKLLTLWFSPRAFATLAGLVIWNLNNFLLVDGLDNLDPINVSKSPRQLAAPSSAFTHKIRNVGRCQANIAFAGVDLDRGPFRDYLY